jgi:acetylglutamate kinase
MTLQALQAKADILIEALPYIRRFTGETLVVKYGGHAMTNPEAALSFAQDVTLLRSIGLRVVVVHGGGPQIQSMLDQLGIDSSFHNGYRVTDEQTMRVVRMVLVGQVNQEIVARINHAGGNAVGLSGADGNLLVGRKVTVGGQDIGRVGIIETVKAAHIHRLADDGFIPVIAPVAVDIEGQALNINADLAASAIASQLKARKLLLMTDVEGVQGEDGDVISSIHRDEVPSLIETNVLRGGMLPKIKCAIDAINAGVRKVHIVDGRLRHAMLLELFTDRGVGTEVV